MSNWLAGGTSAFDVASRQYRMRFKPPMTFRRALEKSTSGTDNFYKSYVREEWTPMAIGVQQHALEPVNALYTSRNHIYDFGTFRLDAGYEVAYIVPVAQMGLFTITITCKVSTRVWVNLAIVQDRPKLTDTPVGSYLLYQTLVYNCEPPLVLKNIAMGPGTEVRVATSGFTDFTITGPVGSTT